MIRKLKFVFFIAAFLGILCQHVDAAEHNELTPDQELIFAVKGYKRTLAAGAVGMVTFNPLLVAAIAGMDAPESTHDLKKIQAALDDGASVNCRDVYTWTPLMYAAYEGYPEITKFLLQKGADKSLTVTKKSWPNWQGYTAFRIAEYYLTESTHRKSTCEAKMQSFYEDRIDRYGQVVGLLR